MVIGKYEHCNAPFWAVSLLPHRFMEQRGWTPSVWVSYITIPWLLWEDVQNCNTAGIYTVIFTLMYIYWWMGSDFHSILFFNTLEVTAIPKGLDTEPFMTFYALPPARLEPQTSVLEKRANQALYLNITLNKNAKCFLSGELTWLLSTPGML